MSHQERIKRLVKFVIGGTVATIAATSIGIAIETGNYSDQAVIDSLELFVEGLQMMEEAISVFSVLV